MTGQHYRFCFDVKISMRIPWIRIFLENPMVPQLVTNFPIILWNAKIHYRDHSNQPLSPNAIFPLRSILPSEFTSPREVFASGFSCYNFVYIYHLPHSCHISFASRPLQFDHGNNMWSRVVKFLI
jgi:hypothetical protein